MQKVFERLLKEVSAAKESTCSRTALFEVYGKITMAFDLKALTREEFLELNRECVAKGINNPKYF